MNGGQLGCRQYRDLINIGRHLCRSIARGSVPPRKVVVRNSEQGYPHFCRYPLRRWMNGQGQKYRLDRFLGCRQDAIYADIPSHKYTIWVGIY